MTEFDDYGTDDFDTEDVGVLTDVEFPDGTTITDPYQDALGQVYKDHDSYVAGTDAYEITDATDDTGQATPAS